MTLSIVMVTYNSAEVVEGAVKSIAEVGDEVLIGDGESTDGTVEIVRKYEGKVIRQKKKNLGQRKQELVERAKGQWIFVLDADERVSGELAEEIGRLGERKRGSAIAYRIPYQNYVFGRQVYYGGEKYAKVRLFRRGLARISPGQLHEEIVMKKGVVGELKGVIHHHSYRTLWQLFTKFTQYSWIAAREKKWQGATLSLEKLFLYGPHMFWARFVKEKGYKDGWRGLVLALAFGYMEGLTYWLMLL